MVWAVDMPAGLVAGCGGRANAVTAGDGGWRHARKGTGVRFRQNF
jgi:hypothetical protein